MARLRPLLRRVLVVTLAVLLALGLADLGTVAAQASGSASAASSCSTSKAKKAKKAKSKKKSKKSKKKKSKKKSKKHKKSKKKKKAKKCTPAKPKPAKPTPKPSPRPDPTPNPSPGLGAGGLVGFTGNQTTAWLNSHPNDPRTPTFRRVISSQATSLWLTGNESFWNLADYVKRARQVDGTMVLTVWNIPLRWDGIGSPSEVKLDAYREWMTKVAQSIGTTRAILVLEPDALWFYDRLPTAAARQQRLQALQAAITALRTYARNTRVYLEAGTTSGSVTPDRMAQILDLAGVRQIAGFAVNVSSFSPTDKIGAYATRIRSVLLSLGVQRPGFVVDTSRNGAPTWDYTWCNPDGRRIGANPGLVGSSSGYDYRLWIKGPGTSDGSCGNGRGSNGGDFLPDVAWKMITG